VLLSLTIGDLTCVYTHTYGSFRSNGAAATRVYRHSRLDKNSAGLRDSELEALYERDGGHGVTFREYRAINYAVSVIGAARARALNPVRGSRPHSRLYFPCPRVRRARYTSTRLAYDFVTIALFCSRQRSALTTHNDATPTAI